jgi:hypothetical protein
MAGRRYNTRAGSRSDSRKPRRVKPSSIIAQVEGSGITVPVSENAALNALAPTMSVPTRSQSGSSAASRVQLCRSVKPGGNDVPGGMIGFGIAALGNEQKYPDHEPVRAHHRPEHKGHRSKEVGASAGRRCRTERSHTLPENCRWVTRRTLLREINLRFEPKKCEKRAAVRSAAPGEKLGRGQRSLSG